MALSAPEDGEHSHLLVGSKRTWIDCRRTFAARLQCPLLDHVYSSENGGEGGIRTHYTLYAPPNYRDGVVHATKADAEADKEHFDGKTTE